MENSTAFSEYGNVHQLTPEGLHHMDLKHMPGQLLDPRFPPSDTLGSLGELKNYADLRLRLDQGSWGGRAAAFH